MKYYKCVNNNIHAIEAGFECLLPSGLIEITKEEADAIAVTNAQAPIYTCTAWQIRKALNALNLRELVESIVAASNDMTLKDGWEFATTLSSNDLFVISMGAALGKTEVETADVIKYASTL
jgi:hypothetical protein